MKVLKVLEKHHMKGTFFVLSGLIGKAGYLDCQQIRGITKKGHEIGSHGQTHQKLCKLDEKQVLSELVTSKTYIEELIGKEIFGFSYPFGGFDKKIKELVKITNYKYARTVRFGTISCPPRDWFEWNPSLMAQGRGGFRKKLLPRYFRAVRPRVFFARGYPRNWVEIAHYMFKNAYTRRGLFHLWGHSCTLCENDDLKMLDKFLLRVSSFSDIWFARNKDIFHYEITKRLASIRINRVASKKTEITLEINPKIESTPITLEIEKPDSLVTFKSDHLSIKKYYRGKKLLVTFSPLCDKITE